jgi:hypothetical protein
MKTKVDRIARCGQTQSCSKVIIATEAIRFPIIALKPLFLFTESRFSFLLQRKLIQRTISGDKTSTYFKDVTPRA